MRIALIPLLLFLMAGCSPQSQPMEQPMVVATPCDAASGQCLARAPDALLTLALTAPKAMEPFEIVATWNGAPAGSVLVNFEMSGMDMGENRYRLVAAGAGQWKGRAVLPVCVTGRSDWIADVQITAGSGSYRARIPFSVLR